MTATDERERTGRQEADLWAAHWQASHLAQAAAFNHTCRSGDPGRSPLWKERALRLLAAADNRSLAERSAVRLAIAGISSDDPALASTRNWNRSMQDRAAGME